MLSYNILYGDQIYFSLNVLLDRIKLHCAFMFDFHSWWYNHSIWIG